MDDRLKEMAESRYQQQEFLATLFELAVEKQWFDVQHMVQHDMAKAILSDYSQELGLGYLDSDIFYRHWEEVITVGWQAFSNHTGVPIDTVKHELQQLHNSI
jgi:uncharacterized protein YijF (DUF1287 family)